MTTQNNTAIICQQLVAAQHQAHHIQCNATNANYVHFASTIKQAIRNAREYLEKLDNCASNQRANLENLVPQFLKQDEQITALEARVDDITEKRNYFRDRTRKLRKEIYNAEKALDEVPHLKQRVEDLEYMLESRNNMPYQRLAERAQLAERQVAALREDNNRLHQENQDMRERIEGHHAIDGLTKENLKLCERNSILALDNQGLRQHNANLEFQIATLKKAAELAKHVDVAGLKMELNEWEAGFNKVRKERDDWRRLCETTSKCCDDLQERRDELKEECENLQDSLRRVDEDRDCWKRGFDNVTKLCGELNEERDVLAKGLDEAVEKLKTAEYVKELSRKAAVAWFENWRKQAEELKDTKEKLENEVGIRGNTIRKLQADNLRAHTLFSRAIQYVPQMSLPGIYRGL